MATNLNYPTFTVTGINTKTTGATVVGTTENGTQRFVPTHIIAEVTATSAPLTAASVSVGTNGASYNNILAITPLTGLTTVNTLLIIPIVLAVGSIAANTAINVNVTTAITGTSQSVRFDVIGYYV